MTYFEAIDAAAALAAAHDAGAAQAMLAIAIELRQAMQAGILRFSEGGPGTAAGRTT